MTHQCGVPSAIRSNAFHAHRVASTSSTRFRRTMASPIHGCTRVGAATCGPAVRARRRHRSAAGKLPRSMCTFASPHKARVQASRLGSGLVRRLASAKCSAASSRWPLVRAMRPRCPSHCASSSESRAARLTGASTNDRASSRWPRNSASDATFNQANCGCHASLVGAWTGTSVNASASASRCSSGSTSSEARAAEPRGQAGEASAQFCNRTVGAERRALQPLGGTDGYHRHEKSHAHTLRRGAWWRKRGRIRPSTKGRIRPRRAEYGFAVSWSTRRMGASLTRIVRAANSNFRTVCACRGGGL